MLSNISIITVFDISLITYYYYYLIFGSYVAVFIYIYIHNTVFNIALYAIY